MKTLKRLSLGTLLILGASAQAGVISGGGAGYPALAPDVKFTYQCRVSLTERTPDAQIHAASMSFVYDQTAGSNSGLLQIQTTKEDWTLTEGAAFSIPLEGHSLAIGAGQLVLTLALDSSTKIESFTQTGDLGTAFQAAKLSGSLKQSKIINGVKHAIDFSVSCKKRP